MSIIGIPTKRAPFLSKMVNKEVLGWTSGWILPLQNLLSVPPHPSGTKYLSYFPLLSDMAVLFNGVLTVDCR